MRNELLILRVLVVILIVLTLFSLVLDIWILLRKTKVAETQYKGKYGLLTNRDLQFTILIHFLHCLLSPKTKTSLSKILSSSDKHTKIVIYQIVIGYRLVDLYI